MIGNVQADELSLRMTRNYAIARRQQLRLGRKILPIERPVRMMAQLFPALVKAIDSFPNLHVETAARLGELGRQPRRARAFFEKYQDRIMFGTDATPRDRKSTRLN